MFNANIGIAGQEPSIYLAVGDDAIKDIFLSIGSDMALYPVADTGHAYAGATDQKWFFSYQDIGNDVDTTVAINVVSMTFMGALPFGKTIHCYFKTGGVKYYFDTQTSQVGPPTVDFKYGEGGPSAVHNWKLNPATGLPWRLAQITAGEFGFETSGDFTLHAAFVSIYWGAVTADTVDVSGVPIDPVSQAGGPGGDPLAAPCGQTATMESAFTNYDAKILEVKPSYGSLAGGTEISIRGYNFVDGSTITIGGAAATSVTFIDDQHYVATVPAHAVGFADVVINEPAGTSLVYRNGFQYTLFTRGDDIRRMPGVSIHLGLNSGSNACSFQVDGESNPPKVGEKIQIIDEFVTPRRLLFAGNVQSVEQVYEGQRSQLAWNVNAVDFTWLLNRRRPFGEYHNMSASAIAKDLILRYAPGFTSDFVQTNLAKVSIAFDGSWDLQTCLSVLARMIGGGHWYVDFNQDLHFFHVVPPNANMPTAPTTAVNIPSATGAVLRVGPGSAPTVAQGAAFGTGFSFTPGIAFFQVSFVYDNGTESAYGPATCVALDGQHKVVFSDIPIGAAVGALTVIKRRIYVKLCGVAGGSKRVPFCQVDDNVTTGFTTVGYAPQTNIEIANVSSTVGQVAPSEAFVSPPAYLQTSVPNPFATSTLAIVCQPEYRPASQSTNLSWTPSTWRFRVSDIYQDLTESQLGAASIPFTSDGASLVHLNNVPVGGSVNGVTVIARRIMAAFGTSAPSDVDYKSWWIIPNNTETTADVSPATGGTGIGGAQVTPFVGTQDQSPVWPNNDGPFLEGFDEPDDVTDDNVYLLRNPQITSTVDLSQIRNRIFIRGAGSSSSDTVGSTSTIIPVADCSFYSSNGGQVFVEGQILTYTGISNAEGPGNLILSTQAGEQINSGAPVSLYLMVEDKTSQEDIGRVELDFNGRPTDGIHEFVIIDGSLETTFQMYMRGYAELELYARPITTVRYSTRDPKTRPGAVVNINLTEPPISGEFLIQDVSIDQIHNEADDLLEPRYNVTTSSSRFDLNDLLFQFNTRTSSPVVSPSTSGVVASAVEDASGSSSSPRATNMWTGVSPTSGAKVDQVWASTLSGIAVSYVVDAGGYWIRLGPTSTGEGGETTLLSAPNSSTFRCDQGFVWSTWVRVPSGSFPGSAAYIGLYDAAHGDLAYDGPSNGNSRAINNTRKFIGVRLSDLGWKMIVGDGTTMQEYGTLHDLVPDVAYNVNIRVISPTAVAGSGFGAFYKTNFPGGAIEISVVAVNEVSSGHVGRVQVPSAILSTGLFGWIKLWNAETPSPNTAKTLDVNTVSGAYGDH